MAHEKLGNGSYTPGPWKVDGLDNGPNARLIAAAPDLYEALQNLMNGIDTGLVRLDTDADETLANAMQKIRAALSAAQPKGETK